jgi:hypothetical protein
LLFRGDSFYCYFCKYPVDATGRPLSPEAVLYIYKKIGIDKYLKRSKAIAGQCCTNNYKPKKGATK